MLGFCHFRVFTRVLFQNVPIQLFSKSTAFKICQQKIAVFCVNGNLSVTFFTVFKIYQHPVSYCKSRCGIFCKSATMSLGTTTLFIDGFGVSKLRLCTQCVIKHNIIYAFYRPIFLFWHYSLCCSFSGLISLFQIKILLADSQCVQVQDY